MRAGIRWAVWWVASGALLTGCLADPAGPSGPRAEAELILAKRTGYQAAVDKLEKSRAAFRDAYQAASATRKDEILEEARAEVFKVLREDLFPAWYGTTWAFEGVTQNSG